MPLYAVHLKMKCIGNDNIRTGYYTGKIEFNGKSYPLLATHIVNASQFNETDAFNLITQIAETTDDFSGKIVRIPARYIKQEHKP